jgi:flagellar hook-associated protein 2
MGNVGLSFGSATSGKGFDVAATVSQIVTNLQSVETPWKTQLTKLTAQDTQLSSLGAQLSALTSDLQDLSDFTGVLSGKKGSSSNENVLSLSSASSSAIAGTHTITVENLAQTSAAVSGIVSKADILSGSVTIQVGTGDAHTVNVGDGSTAATIQGLAQAINLAGIGVTASILTDTKGSRLSVVSSTDGAAGTLTVSSTLTDTSTANLSVSLAQIQTGKDANFLVDGVELSSPSNTVTNAISGVTFQLLSAPTDLAAVQVVITNDTPSVVSAVSQFVVDYNTVMKAIKAQEGNDSSGKAEPLYGTSVLARLQEALQSGLSSTYGSGGVSSLNSLGITFNRDGSISLNSDTLTSILNSNYAGVTAFFQNAGGFGATFGQTLNNLGNVYATGAITSALKENKRQEDALSENVAKQEELIAVQKDRLTAQLNAANQTLQAIPSLVDQISMMYSAMTGYNTKNG